jgi:hypothetical protein
MPEITVNSTATRINATQVKVSGTYTCEGQGSIAVTLSGNGAGQGGKTVTGPSGGYDVTVTGGVHDGECQAHATINQITPAATDSFDGPVKVS